MKIPARIRPFARRVQELLGKDLYLSPDVTVDYEVHGSEYGGFAVLSNSLSADSVVVSCGLGEDITFDLSLIGKYGCLVYGFDPTPRSVSYLKGIELPSQFSFYPMAVSDSVGEIELFLPAIEEYVSASMVRGDHTSGKSLKVPSVDMEALVALIGSDRIDLLKLDVEGAEYGVLAQLERLSTLPAQLAVEFHHFYPEIGLDATRGALAKLKAMGYKCAWVSPSHHELLLIRQES